MLNPSASSFVPSWATTRRKYTNDQLTSLQSSALQEVKEAGWAAAGPFDRLPGPVADIVASCPRAFEFIDMNIAGAIMEGCKPQAVVMVPAAVVLDDHIRTEQTIVASRKRCHGYVLGPFLSQSGNVVKSQLQIELAFRFKKTSIKMRQLAEKCPEVVNLVRKFLCGDGFHIQPPPVQNHDQWSMLLERLKFDWIRDNKTKIFTELSKFWKKSHTPFEQFAHFFFYRDATPTHESKGMLTHRQKPIMVATLSGDIDAVVLLCDLGFYVPPDYFWELVGIVGSSTNAQFHEIRKILAYFYDRQPQYPPGPAPEKASQPSILSKVRDPKNPWT